jgi:Ca2+:H+ antiporter
VTLRDRQDAINIEHPFGLPIWKPALYRKSRSVTRNAEDALHSKPSAAAERHLLPGNILWVLVFGWWLALSCASVALVVSGVEVLAGGRGGYGRTLRGLAWYIGWPFGKYVEGEGAPASEAGDEESSGEGEGYGEGYGAALTESSSSTHTVRAPSPISPVTPSPTSHPFAGPGRGVSFAPGVKPPDETAPLLPQRKRLNRRARQLGRLAYWPGFFLIVAPVMLVVCVICWFLVITIPMAKLTWELLELLYYRPLEINFRSAPSGDDANATDARLHPGQVAPTAGPTSTVLLCTYRAVGLQYVKYTVGGVNIMFINLLPLVFFTIFDGIVLLPMVEKAHREGRPVSPILNVLASQALIFVLGLASVIPLSYFLGMAVASISAQSSIGMGAVINATFGSIIEIVLYGIALTQGKGRLVEGSIVGSILAGVLLMPGASMCSGALKRKEQKFNAKSAGVTSTMLIMAIIGTLTPTMFYQVYGSFELHCEGCPSSPISEPDQTWKCKRCYYEYPEPTTDPFYQHQVKALMYACAVILVLSYLIGLWFSLRTHASQIWQNPQRVMAKEEVAPRPARITPAVVMNPTLPVSQMASHGPSHAPSHVTPQAHSPHRRSRTTPPDSPAFHRRDIEAQHPHQQPQPQGQGNHHQHHATHQIQNENENVNANANLNPNTGYTPLLQSLKHGGNLDSISPLPAQMTHEDFRRAVNTLATAISKRDNKEKDDDDDGAGGHEAPSWTRGVSAAVLLGCTLLYAIIAEVLVDVVDVVLAGSGVDEKFLGLTLFALVPNTTEFMNAMSFALQGNIALSMEIGSAYALQVCLLQIPAMVAFSAFTNPAKFGDQIDTFTLIFPRWDVIAIILAIFLLTYTYIEARSNYHRGSILVLA